MSNTDAWMPFYIGDYLGDTQRLTTEQHGAYLLLILDYWRNGPAPDDDAVLAQITRLDAKVWKRHRPALARMFRIGHGEWRHKRIDRELDDAAANAERRSSKAKKAAEARWGSADASSEQSSKDAPSNAPSMPQAMLVECPPPSPSPSPNGDTFDGGRASARVEPESVAILTDELCRTAGVRNVDPGSIIKHQQLVTGWLAEGLDPDQHIRPAIRDTIANASERISSLKYFDNPVRQFRAREEAQSHGHSPRQRSSDPQNPIVRAAATRHARRTAAAGDDGELRQLASGGAG